MSRIIEIDEHGAIQLPDDVLAAVKPPVRYVVEVQGATLILHPEAEHPVLAMASPAERAEAVRRWAALERLAAPVLTDEMIRGTESSLDHALTMPRACFGKAAHRPAA